MNDKMKVLYTAPPRQSELPDDGVESAKIASEKKKKNAAKELLEWIELFGYAVGVVLTLFIFVCRIAVVNGPSMEPTLTDGQVLIVSDLFYEPEQGDVVVFQSNTILGNEAIVKRVIATEGQTVDIDFETWTVTVDGVALEEDYVKYIKDENMRGAAYSFPITVEENMLFVLGDNRNHSSDSRDERIGQVDERYILGRVLFRVYPFDVIGGIK